MCRAALAASGILSLIQNQTVERTELKAVSKSNAFSIMVQAFQPLWIQKVPLGFAGDQGRGSLLQKHFPYFWKTREFLIFAAFSLYTPEKNQRRRAMPKKMPAARRADQWKLLRGTAKHVTIMEINYKTFAQSIGICKGEKYDGIQSASNGFG